MKIKINGVLIWSMPKPHMPEEQRVKELQLVSLTQAWIILTPKLTQQDSLLIASFHMRTIRLTPGNKDMAPWSLL